MQLEYYDPMLFVSTSAYPNTMGMTATLNEDIDGNILQQAVENLRERFPYFFVRAEVDGNDLIPVPNPLSVIVRNTWEPIHLNSKEANYHLMAFKHEGKRIALEISHSITDGAGVMPFFKSVLYCYLSRKTGMMFNPDGVRLPGDEIPETEIGDPFPELDLDSVDAPFYQKERITDFYRLSDLFSSSKNEPRLFCLKLAEAEVMRYCSENDGSPNVLISVLLARALRKINADIAAPVTAAIAIDHKAMLGNYDNYRLFANVASIDFSKLQFGEDIMKTCTAVRGQLMLQAQPENSLFFLKTRKEGFERMKQMPLQMKIDVLKKAVSSQIATLSVSYVNCKSFGSLDTYIEELYNLCEASATDINCEITCINHSFFLAVAQSFSSDEYMKAFLGELANAKIPYELIREESFKLCGVRYDGISEVDL